jgi:hypothetical protein
MAKLITLLACLFVVLIIPYCQSAVTSIISKEQKVTLTFFESYDLVCEEAGPDAVKITWKFNGSTLIPPADKDKKKDDPYTFIDSNNTLRINNIEPKVVANYSCNFTQGDDMHETVFTVRVRAYVGKFEKTRNVIEGDPLSLDCRAWGVPSPTIRWEHNGTVLQPEGSGGKIVLKASSGTSGKNSVKFPPVENGTVRITTMGYPDAGNYTCFATNNIDDVDFVANATVLSVVKDKYAALWPFLGICVEVAVLCAIILIYEKRRAKRIEEEERLEESAHLNANNDTKPTNGAEEVRQRK